MNTDYLQSSKLIVITNLHARTKYFKMCLNRNIILRFLILLSILLGVYFIFTNKTNSKNEHSFRTSILIDVKPKHGLKLKEMNESAEIEVTSKILTTTLSPLERLKMKRVKMLKKLK